LFIHLGSVVFLWSKNGFLNRIKVNCFECVQLLFIYIEILDISLIETMISCLIGVDLAGVCLV
jgi:hypothetical protein